MRLQKVIAQATKLSRRAAEKAIVAGEVTVNGRVVSILGTKIDPLVDRVCLHGHPLNLPERYYYLAFYKPGGLLVTKEDPQDRPTIWEKLSEWEGILNSAGRLDLNSEGLLLLTNDGELLNKLTHPRHEMRKVYEVKVRGIPTLASINRLQTGVKLEEGKTAPAQVKILRKEKNFSYLEIGIREGRKRQVRRMCKAVGHHVLRLKRVSIGPIKLGKLKSGKWRHLSLKEVAALKSGRI